MACTTSDYAVGVVDAELDHGVFPDNSSPSEDGDSFCGVEVAADMSSLGSYMEVVPSSTGSLLVALLRLSVPFVVWIFRR